MDDSYKAVADRVGIHALEFSNGLEYQLIGQLGGLVQRRAGQYLGYSAAGHLGCIHDISAGGYDIAGYSVKRASGLRAEKLCSLFYLRVNMGQFQHVRAGDIIAVLRHSSLYGGHVKAIAVRGYTFGEGCERLGQRAVFAELDGLTAILGYGVLVAELVMHKVRLSVVYEPILIVGVHTRCKALGVGSLRVGVSKQAEVYSGVEFSNHAFSFQNNKKKAA